MPKPRRGTGIPWSAARKETKPLIEITTVTTASSRKCPGPAALANRSMANHCARAWLNAAPSWRSGLRFQGVKPTTITQAPASAIRIVPARPDRPVHHPCRKNAPITIRIPDAMTPALKTRCQGEQTSRTSAFPSTNGPQYVTPRSLMAFSVMEYPPGHRCATSTCTGSSRAEAIQHTAPARQRLNNLCNYPRSPVRRKREAGDGRQ